LRIATPLDPSSSSLQYVVLNDLHQKLYGSTDTGPDYHSIYPGV